MEGTLPVSDRPAEPSLNNTLLTAATAHRVHDLAARSIVIGASPTARLLGLSDPPVYAAIERLEHAGILREATGRKRGRLHLYAKYLEILGEGTEPI
jgi:hypothetical protein